jgi:EmrB/QacA subfamily drug resistance transporter
VPQRRTSVGWTFLITSIGLFMVALDNLVVITALPVIRTDLGASLADLEWMVNAYTLTFAVLLLTGAALGDRFGRRRVFVIGLAIFTIGSAAAALAPTSQVLILARALQGVGGAIVTPLTLTILSAGVPLERRAVALGAWGGVGGLAVAVGPVVGGAIAQGVSWHWIFWLNVPIGIVAMVLAYFRLAETHGPEGGLDLVGLALASGGLLGLVWGVIHGNDRGWTDVQVVAAMAAGVILLAGFFLWERRSSHAMLPLSMFRSRGFSAANAVSFLMYFGMFGSVFLLVQFFQLVQGMKPFEAGLRTLPWTAMPIFVAPAAGLLVPRIGARPIITLGMALLAGGLAYIAAVTTTTVDYLVLVPGFIVSGIGLGLFFAPIANVVLSAVRTDQEGKASGANNAIREVGGVFGVAVLAAVFSANGSYASPDLYVQGLIPAMFIGAAIVAVGAVVSLAIPGRLGIVAGRTAIDELEDAVDEALHTAPTKPSSEPTYARADGD